MKKRLNFAFSMHLDTHRCIIIVACLSGMLSLNAQNFFSELEETLIYYSPEIAPTAVCTGDLDNDGHLDVLSFFLEKFRLYRHTDGAGTFVEQEVISAPEDWMLSVAISDLDGDGRKDIIAASYNNDKILWYKNEGDLAFGGPSVLTDTARGAISVHIEDLDNDGDPDILSASLWDNTVAWYENQGGGVFSAQQVISRQALGPRVVYCADLNADGLHDVLSASIYDHKIAWYENLGNGIFGTQQVITEAAARAWSVYVADLNNDGIPDVLSASSWDNKIAWYENDGAGNFGVQQVISQELDNAQYVHAADLDNDGDQDVLSASLLDDKIAWYENMGAGVFGTQQVVTGSADMPGFVYATDLDGDGYRDILSASTDFKIAWYENTLPMKMAGSPEDTTIYPGQDATFGIIAEAATGYRWQCNTGYGFVDLTNDAVYAGADTDTLEISGATFDFQGYSYRCVAINGSDSLSSTAATLRIIDTIQPVISSSHPDIILPADEACFAMLPDFRQEVVATDNSFDTVFIIQDPLPWNWIPAGGGEVTLTAADPAGNKRQVTFNVQVADETPPAYTLSELPELDTNANGQFVLPDYTGFLEVTDNCSDGSLITITQTPSPNSLVPDSVYDVPVTITFTDASGNSAEASFVATTIDVIPPVITSTHHDTTLEGNYACLAYMPDFTADVKATDNADAPADLVITQSEEANTIIYGSENPVTINVHDLSGNAEEVTFNVVVTGEQPTIDCIGDQVVELSEGQSTYTVSGVEFNPVSMTVGCGFGSMVNNLNGSSTLDQYEFSQDTTHVVWTLTDQVGNAAECSFNVVLDQWVGVDDFRKHGVSVYPNPTTGELHYESSDPVIQLRIVDVTGKLILEKAPNEQAGTIELTGFQRGSYILNIRTGQHVFRKLIVKE